MNSCACPDLDLNPREPIPSEPLKCGCCGHPLELTCAGNCGPQHVRGAMPSANTVARVSKPRTYQPKVCACGATFAPSGPRDVRCATCKGAA